MQLQEEEVVWTSLWRSVRVKCILLSSLCSPYHSCIPNLRKGLDVVQCHDMLMFSVKKKAQSILTWCARKKEELRAPVPARSLEALSSVHRKKLLICSGFCFSCLHREVYGIGIHLKHIYAVKLLWLSWK